MAPPPGHSLPGSPRVLPSHGTRLPGNRQKACFLKQCSLEKGQGQKRLNLSSRAGAGRHQPCATPQPLGPPPPRHSRLAPIAGVPGAAHGSLPPSQGSGTPFQGIVHPQGRGPSGPLAPRGVAEGASASAEGALAAVDARGLEEIYGAQRTWQWRGHSVNYSVLGESRVPGGGAAAVLVHGFGASIGHWRKTMPLLARDKLCTVYALDLLGLGASAKPAGLPYSIELWAEMVDDFAAEVVKERQVVFMGNSIGSLITLAAAAGPASGKAGLAGRVSGVVLLNCAGGLNNKAIVDDWRIKLALPIFLFIDFLLGIPPVARAIFNAVKTRDNVKAALSSVYCNQDNVDDELVELILRPADDEGALGVFIAVLTGPPGPRPEVLIPEIKSPILILWGDKDPFTPSDGPIGKYFKELPSSRDATSFVTLHDVGHCPQDDRPELVHDALLPWLDSLFAEKASS